MAGDPPGAFGSLEDSERRRLGRFGGVLLVLGAAMSIPARLALDPPPEWGEHLIAASAAAAGLLAYFAPWERLADAWLHLAMIVATVEIAIGVGVLSDDYAFYYVLVAMYAAYVVRDRTVLLLYILLFTVALAAPVAYSERDATEEARHILITMPVLVIAAAIVRYLRDTLERREEQYRNFANEAVALAARIRGPGGGEDRLDELARELDREP
jgi:signal transduction histidine kinase